MSRDVVVSLFEKTTLVVKWGKGSNIETNPSHLLCSQEKSTQGLGREHWEEADGAV